MRIENAGSILRMETKLRLKQARWGFPKSKILILGKFEYGEMFEYRLDSDKKSIWINEASLKKYCEVVL